MDILIFILAICMKVMLDRDLAEEWKSQIVISNSIKM